MIFRLLLLLEVIDQLLLFPLGALALENDSVDGEGLVERFLVVLLWVVEGFDLLEDVEGGVVFEVVDEGDPIA